MTEIDNLPFIIKSIEYNGLQIGMAIRPKDHVPSDQQ